MAKAMTKPFYRHTVFAGNHLELENYNPVLCQKNISMNLHTTLATLVSTKAVPLIPLFREAFGGRGRQSELSLGWTRDVNIYGYPKTRTCLRARSDLLPFKLLAWLCGRSRDIEFRWDPADVPSDIEALRNMKGSRLVAINFRRMCHQVPGRVSQIEVTEAQCAWRPAPGILQGWVFPSR